MSARSGDRRPLTIASAGIALIASALVGIAWPSDAARADDGGITTDDRDGALVSDDGVTYSTSLPRALFADLGAIAPGGRWERTVWVRNGSDEDAVLRVSAVGASATSRAFADALRLRASAQEAGGDVAEAAASSAARQSAASAAEVSFTTIGLCRQLTSDRILAAGESLPVRIDLRFADVTGRQAVQQAAGADLRFTLRDPLSAATAATECPAGPTVPVLPGDQPASDEPVTPAVPPDAGTDARPSAPQTGAPEWPSGPAASARTPFGVLALTGGSFYSALVTAFSIFGTGVLLVVAARRRREQE